MRQIFYLESTEPIFERACQLRNFEDSGDLSWSEWYDFNISRTHMSAGELEQAIAETLNIPAPARIGFAVSGIDKDTIILTDLEENGNCDLNDAEDAHMVLPVTQFREWLYKWNADPLNRVMDTQEAAAFWGYEHADSVKRLCRQEKVKCRKLTNGTYILNRNQPNPKHKK